TEPPSDKSPAASDTRPSPETDAQKEAPSENGDADEPADSANEAPAAAPDAEKNKDENEHVTIAAGSALPIETELSAETPEEQGTEQKIRPEAETPEEQGAEQETPVAIRPETETSEEGLPTPSRELGLFSDDLPEADDANTSDEGILKMASRAVQRGDSEQADVQAKPADDAAQRAAASQEREQVAAAVNADKTETTKRSAEEDPSAGKPTAPRSGDVAGIAPVPDSSSQESEADGGREKTRSPSLPQTTTKESDPSAATTQRFAQHLVARGGERAAEGVQLNSAEQTRFVDRVARAFRAAEGRNGIVRLRLSPPELGSLRLEIKVQGGVLAARLEADTPTARSLLIDNLPALRERLAEQGIRVEQFDVELLDRHSNGGFDGWEQREQRHTDDGERSESSTSSLEATDEPSSRERPGKRPGEDEQLNVVI
ncbi:MAG: flagellar hook-length control protein FliK, partial [Pirellulaceae bacterium]